MEYLVLLGIAVVIVGFALRLDAILIVFLAAIVTALLGNLGIDGFLTTLNRSSRTAAWRCSSSSCS